MTGRAATTLAGLGLHGGLPARVSVARSEGLSRFASFGGTARLGDTRVVRVDQGVAIVVGDGVVELVEHAAAVLGGLSAFRGVELAVEGGEVPLLDGGAAQLAKAVHALGVAPSPPLLRVARAFRLDVGVSSYAIEPATGVDVRCDVVFDHPLIGAQRATFGGDPADFLARIAPARTFGFARDHGEMLARGRARAVDPAAVVVFTEEGLWPGCELASADEPARHKLLDLIGDLALYGGPPIGRVSALRPGHAATHAFVRAALGAGALVVDA